MASNKKQKTFTEQQKRHHDSDSEPDMTFSQEEINEVQAQHQKFREDKIKQKLNQKFWPKFFQIYTPNESEKPITALSPFFIQKAIHGLVGTVSSIKKIFRKDQTPYLLVEVVTDQQS